MINKTYRDINTNAYYADIVIVSNYTDGKSVLSFTGLLKSGRKDLETEVQSIHPEANNMEITLIPSDNLQGVVPFHFNYTGTWSELQRNIKSKLLELNRLQTSRSAGITFTLDQDRTKVINFIKSNESDRSKFQQTITQTDSDYVKVEEMIKKITKLNNNEQLRLFGEYIYNIMINEG